MPQAVPNPAAGGAQAPQPQQAPMGSSPVTGPTPNQGYEAAGTQRLGMVVKHLTDLLPMVGASSDIGQAVLKSIQSLAKFVPPGAVSPAAERNINEQQMMRSIQNGQQLGQLRAMAGGAGGAPGAAAQPPKAA